MVAAPASLRGSEHPRRGRYEEYHPYGSTAWWSGDGDVEVSRKRYRYTGMERDEETGLQCHGVRYYAPWLGRWMSADPIGLGDGVNRFAYCHGGPVGGRDESGMKDDPITVERGNHNLEVTLDYQNADKNVDVDLSKSKSEDDVRAAIALALQPYLGAYSPEDQGKVVALYVQEAFHIEGAAETVVPLGYIDITEKHSETDGSTTIDKFTVGSDLPFVTMYMVSPDTTTQAGWTALRGLGVSSAGENRGKRGTTIEGKARDAASFETGKTIREHETHHLEDLRTFLKDGLRELLGGKGVSHAGPLAPISKDVLLPAPRFDHLSATELAGFPTDFSGYLADVAGFTTNRLQHGKDFPIPSANPWALSGYSIPAPTFR